MPGPINEYSIVVPTPAAGKEAIVEVDLTVGTVQRVESPARPAR